jgi:hypothetical protein
MRRALLALLLLSACDVPVFWIDARADTSEQGSFARIEEACEFWGLNCYETDDPQGALTIILSDHGGTADDELYHSGHTSDKACDPLVWATDDGFILEHETGHAFSLSHRKNTDNVMFVDQDVAGSDTTKWQVGRVQRAAARLAACIGN